MERYILVINPGSTSTKTAVYCEKTCLFTEEIQHSAQELEGFSCVADQYEMRCAHVLDTLKKHGIEQSALYAIAARGGLLPPGPGGARRVNQAMVDRLRNAPLVEHASNLAAIMAYEIAQANGIEAYIYDPITTDELWDAARISGIPQISRTSTVHALNSRAAARDVAEQLGKPYEQANLIVAHLGGGVSYSAHLGGRMVDLVLSDEGSFAMILSGGLPASDLVKLCFSGRYSPKEVGQLVRGSGGVRAYLGTVDAREVERRIADGDSQAKLIYDALAYQAAKAIAQLAIVFDGNVDAVVLTGGLANSAMLMEQIKRHVSFLAPVYIIPGEREMEALAGGILRVLDGEEVAGEYEE